MKYGIWKVGEYGQDEVQTLLKAGYSPLTARVLCARGLHTPVLAQEYLRCDAPLCDPFAMRDMKKAADRVRLAVARREHIAVFGDYDVDGITSTCLLTDFLQSIGGRVTSYIPARLEEGYGLNETAIEQLYRKRVSLIVAVDCGITATAEAELCAKLGMDLVITDHHECKAELPCAVAVVDPHRRDRTYPHTDLSGVGVAFKLACAICGDQEGMLQRYAELLALGLIADVMPLRGEVRTMVCKGLQALEHTKRPGLRALMEQCGCAHQPITTATIGYVLAPRINAAGRMGQVELALKLFMTQDEQEGADAADALYKLNRERQKIEAGIYQQAASMLPAGEPPAAIVLSSESWHQGVVGIVASRLSEEYGCPTFLVCMDGEKGKASSRSYGGFNLFSSLSSLSELLENYGGHELAAGFTISRQNLPLFRERITRLAREYAAHGEGAALTVDCAVSPALLTVENIRGLEQLEPCGSGCPSPILYLENLTVEQLSEVSSGKHLRLRLRYGSDRKEFLSGIFFSTTSLKAGICPGDLVDVAFIPQINEYRGITSVQLNLVDIRPCLEQRRQMNRHRELYSHYLGWESLTPAEADRLLPVRNEFVAVWRYLISHSRENSLQEDFCCMSRRISRDSGLSISMCRVRICLDVFAERGLIALEHCPGYFHIQILSDGQKVDLSQSPILCRLNLRKGGK